MHRKGRFGFSNVYKRFGGRRHELTLSQRKLVIKLLDENKSQSAIAKILSCSQSQISRIASRKSDILALYDKCKNPDVIRRKSKPRRSALFSQNESTRSQTTIKKTTVNSITCSGITKPSNTAFNKKDLNSIISRITILNRVSTPNGSSESNKTKPTSCFMDNTANNMEELCSSTNDVIDDGDKNSSFQKSEKVEPRDEEVIEFHPLPDSVESTDSMNSSSQNDYHDDSSIMDDFALDLSNMRPKRGKALTLVHKKLIIEMLEAKKSQTEIARMFGKSQSVVSRMAAKKARILDQWSSVKGNDKERLLREKHECELLLCPKKGSPMVTTTGGLCEQEQEEEASSSSDIYRKRQALSLSQKLEIIELLKHKSSQRDIAKIYGKSQAVISRIAGRKEIILDEWEKQKRIKSRLHALYPDVTIVTESGVSVYESSSDISASDILEAEDGYGCEKESHFYEAMDESKLSGPGDAEAPTTAAERELPVASETDVTIPGVISKNRNWLRFPKMDNSRERGTRDRFSLPDADVSSYGVGSLRATYSLPGISRRKRYRGLLLSERKLAIKLLEENKSQTEIARILGCSQSQISRIQAKKNSIINMSEDFVGSGQTDNLRYSGTEPADFGYGCMTSSNVSGSTYFDVERHPTKQEFCDVITYPNASDADNMEKQQSHDVTMSPQFDLPHDNSNPDGDSHRNEQFVHSGFESNATTQPEEELEIPGVKMESAAESDPVPSAADALNGLRTIRRYMQFSGIQNFQFFNSLESQLFCHISKLLR